MFRVPVVGRIRKKEDEMKLSQLKAKLYIGTHVCISGAGND